MDTHENREAEINQKLAELGIDVAVSIKRGIVTLEGVVTSPEVSRAAEDVVREVDSELLVSNQLEILDMLVASDQREDGSATDQLTDALRRIDEGVAGEARRTRNAALSDDVVDPREGGTAEPFFPATDPVVRPSNRDVEMLGGFSETSMDELVEEPYPGERRERGDEEIADDVRRELAEDALTSQLRIDVNVDGGTVHLRGTVPGIEDVEAAEEVASRVPGVEEVVEELVVQP